MAIIWPLHILYSHHYICSDHLTELLSSVSANLQDISAATSDLITLKSQPDFVLSELQQNATVYTELHILALAKQTTVLVHGFIRDRLEFP